MFNSLEPEIEKMIVDMIATPTFKLRKLLFDWNSISNFEYFNRV